MPCYAVFVGFYVMNELRFFNTKHKLVVREITVNVDGVGLKPLKTAFNYFDDKKIKKEERIKFAIELFKFLYSVAYDLF